MTIQLSPHGEGYCKECRFIVGLTEDGRLEPHERGRTLAGSYGRTVVWCPGGDRRPAPKSRVPFFSRLSAFRLRSHSAPCPSCGKTVKVHRLLQLEDRYVYARHFQPGHGLCVSSFDAVPTGVTIR